jgi:hypothetical protein
MNGFDLSVFKKPRPSSSEFIVTQTITPSTKSKTPVVNDVQTAHVHTNVDSNDIVAAKTKAVAIIPEIKGVTIASEIKAVTVTLEIKAVAITPATDFDICMICGSTMHLDCADIKLLCRICGYTSEMPDPNSVMQATPYYNLEKKQTLLSHARLKKLKDFMKNIFSKHKSVVPTNVLIDISQHLTSERGIKTASQLEFDEIVSLIDSNEGFKKFNAYKMQIYCRLKGCDPPQLRPHEEEALFVLFIAIQGPFDNLKKSQKTTFFTIGYVFYVLCKFLGFVHILKFVSIHRTRSKLNTQQDLMKTIFDHLRWAPFPLLLA